MTQQTLSKAIPPGEALLLDTSTLIAYLDGRESVSPVATHIVNIYVREGRNPGLVSVVSVMETLVGPLRRSSEAYRQVVDFLTTFPNLHAIALDFAVAHEAARLRAAHNFSTPDALIIASAISVEVHHIATNDETGGSKLEPLDSGCGRSRGAPTDHPGAIATRPARSKRRSKE